MCFHWKFFWYWSVFVVFFVVFSTNTLNLEDPVKIKSHMQFIQSFLSLSFSLLYYRYIGFNTGFDHLFEILSSERLFSFWTSSDSVSKITSTDGFLISCKLICLYFNLKDLEVFVLFEFLNLFLKNQWIFEFCHFYLISFNLAAWSP